MQMLRSSKFLGGVCLLAMALGVGGLAPEAQAQQRVVTVSSTGSMISGNPYGDSATQMNNIWCQIYGCLFRFSPQTNDYEGYLAESWENVSPNVWRVVLRDDLVRHDGGPPPRAEDVIHSIDRINTDPDSQQGHRVATIERAVALDERTVEIHTTTPDVTLIDRLADSFIVTSKELFDAHGTAADTSHPYGWGPFTLNEYLIDDRIVMERSEHWPHEEGVPEVIVYQQIREATQRVTAMLNGEIQVARAIPPELLSRFDGRDDIQLIESNSNELMFMAMNVGFEPWDDVRIRRAAAMAIDREAIIDRLLGGKAVQLEGVIGEGQFCYSGLPDNPVTYDPEGARALLAEAGYPNGGPAVQFFTPNGRYLADREVGQVIAAMLEQVGFEVDFQAPEWGSLWADIRTGRAPAYYMGRGTVVDPAIPMIQYFGTGETPRIQYSNPELDEMLDRQAAEFDVEARCALLREINQLIIDESPAHFLWTYMFTTATPAGTTVEVLPNGELWLAGMRM